MKIIRVIFLLLSVILAVLPWLPAPIAGSFIFLSLAAIPIFIIDIIFLLTIKRKRHHRHHRHHRPWYKKLNGWRIAFSIVLIGLLPMLHGYLPLLSTQTVPDSKHPTPITIVSWNVDIFQLKSEILRSSANLINSHHPDIICFQERPHDNLMHWDSIKAAFPDYPYTIKNTREDEVLNLAILSRYPINHLREFYYPNSFNKAMRVDLQIGKQKVRLYNVHLETTSMGSGNRDTSTPALFRMQENSVQRAIQSHELAEDIQRTDNPILFCGDFNDTRCGYPYRRLTLHLSDLARLAPMTGSYQDYGNFLKIDYILYSQDFSPSTYDLVSNDWSDHKIQIGKVYF